ncbi:hypothetical protein HNY73_011111 [Argiope bruennichi]|uniref:Uncharacterized protein n=1 Tax=Argiope bruennichi TaxID=94029 RepID=A0A8T0F9C1_ARGBR|nr:hypothetical protein HNY73_011111 [Argiope bruennichi]
MRDEAGGDTLLPRPYCKWRDSVQKAEADGPRQLFSAQAQISFSRAEKEKMGYLNLANILGKAVYKAGDNSAPTFGVGFSTNATTVAKLGKYIYFQILKNIVSHIEMVNIASSGATARILNVDLVEGASYHSQLSEDLPESTLLSAARKKRKEKRDKRKSVNKYLGDTDEPDQMSCAWQIIFLCLELQVHAPLGCFWRGGGIVIQSPLGTNAPPEIGPDKDWIPYTVWDLTPASPVCRSLSATLKIRKGEHFQQNLESN